MELSRLNSKETDFVRNLFLFKNTEEELVARALSDRLCEVAEFCKGEIVYSIHDYRHSLGCILSGTVQVSKTTSEEHRYIMNTLRQGSSFGAAAVFCDSPEYVTVLKASTPCRILFFPQELLERLIAESPVVAKNYVVFLSDRIRFLNDKIQGLISASTGQALANYLINSCEEEDGRPVVRLDGSVSALAGKLNIGRSSLYRAFDTLEHLGIILREDKKIMILDPESLERFY
ncbi:MAG: Crp/Fnr family transcriptional regulator [Clostridia bacterium]|nr:Crp/Fnr family transcriptional regulator [Clostridia bacterium]